MLATTMTIVWVAAVVSPYVAPPPEKRRIAECFDLESAYVATAHFRLAPPAFLGFVAGGRSAEAWRAAGERFDNGTWDLACSAYFRAAAAYALRGEVDAKNTWGNHGLAAAHILRGSYLMDIWLRPTPERPIHNNGNDAQFGPRR